MNNTSKRFTSTLMGIMTAFLFPFEMAQADPGNEMGCISRQQGSMKFVRSEQLDRETILEAAKTQRLQGAKTIDPCLTGQVKHVPASVYAKMAERYPDKYQPLEDLASMATSSGKSAGSAGTAAKHKAPQYRYNNIAEATPPDILVFAPTSLKNDDKVYGTAYTEFFDGPPFFTSFAAVFEDGAVTMLQNSKGFSVNSANARGTLGGGVVTDSENLFTQAALFYDNKIHLIPRLPGEISSQVILLNDRGVAMIFSLDENFNFELALYKNGQLIPLDFGPNVQSPFFLSMNNKGIISGTTFIDGVGYRGFRHDPRENQTTMLEPLPTEPDAWAMGINNRGDVLGYSFVFGGIERIGVWNAKGKFKAHFVEGTPEFPTISNNIAFNDNNLIVISQVSNPPSERRRIYLVPKPGVRLNLDDFLSDVPSGHDPYYVSAINNRGSMIGLTVTPENDIYDFILKRIGQGHH